MTIWSPRLTNRHGTNVGIRRYSVAQYEAALKSGKFLVIAHGTSDEAAKAKGILKTTGATQIAAHSGVSAT